MSKAKNKHVHQKQKISETPLKKKLVDISIIFFLFSVLIIPNIFYKPALDKHLDVRYFSLALFLLVLFVHQLFIKKNKLSKTDFSILKTPVILAYLGYFIVVSLSSLWAINFSEASYEFLKTATFFFLFIYIVLFVAPLEKSTEMFISTMILLGIILSLIGFSQLKEAYDELGFGIKTAYKVIGNNAHKNIFSQVLFLTFAFSAYGIYIFKDFRNKFAIVSAFASLLLILILMTRSVWVAILVATIVSVGLYFILLRKNIPFKNLKNLIIPLAIIGVIAVIIFSFYSGLDSKKQVRTHISESTHLKEGNAQHRIFLWKKSYELLKEKPLLGVGAGNWKIDILKLDVTKANKKGHIVPRRTHNDYVQVITETGIIGFLLYASIFALIIFQAFKLLKILEKEEDKILTLTLLFALIGYLTYSFFSFPKERIETQMFLNTIMAFIVYKYYTLTKKVGDKKSFDIKTIFKPIAAVAIIFLALAVKSGADRVHSEVNVNKIYSLRNTKDFDQVYDLAGDAISPFSKISPFSEPFIKLQGAMLYQKKINGQDIDIQQIVDKYEASLKEIPFHVKTLLEFAQVYVTEGNYEKALEYSTLAYEYAPSNFRVLVVHAYFLKKAGKFDEGYQILKQIDPNKKYDHYVAVRKEFLQQIILNNYNYTSNNLVKTILNSKSQSNDAITNLYLRSFENNESFEKTLMSQVIKQMIKNNSLSLSDTSISNIINKYNINLDSLNAL